MKEPERSWTQTVNEAEAREEARQRERMRGNSGWDDNVSIGGGCTFILLAAFLVVGAALLMLMLPSLDCASDGDPEGLRGYAREPIEHCSLPASPSPDPR